MFHKTLILIVLVTLVLFISGCNTIAGVGRDLSAAADGTGQYLAKQYAETDSYAAQRDREYQALKR